MANKWRSLKLGDCGVLRNGVNFNQSQEGAGLPVLKVKDFHHRVFVPQELLDELSSEATNVPEDQFLEEGDTIIIRSNGNGELVGRSLLASNLRFKTTFSGFCIRFRPDTTVIDPRFAYYLIRSPICRERFVAHGTETGFQNLNQATISGIDIDLPDRQEQLAIARILGTLDLNQARVVSDNAMSLTVSPCKCTGCSALWTAGVAHLKLAFGITAAHRMSAAVQDLRQRSHKVRLFKG